ncbi:YARHG domain-containing protein [Treponema brennaborense]|uniref:YARHG domain-containing protein n=1 Tax=Treponema brennaborense (strain DSM 12168 / CIP 105900 / DD5/3) TaxID=906968 RepID=F4LK86_TREBD|nr:YARHG domain-containing protein [Treponema brennaborense]AEE15475.1 hypothetical protein Trebr_0015 [Treponema brennaborense DSM 12168]
MKKVYIICTLILCLNVVYSQQIEKLGNIAEVTAISGKAGGAGSPNFITVNEKEEIIEVMNESDNTKYTVKGLQKKGKAKYESSFDLYRVKLQEYEIGMSGYLGIKKGDKIILKPLYASSGISFILKEGNGYIVYYVNDKGIPRAVDTEGRIYENTEAIAYLKEYDEQKYEQSVQRATELGLADRFRNNEVLVWGRTYYSTVEILQKFWKPEKYLYPNSSNAIQYDLQGNGYMENFRYKGDGTNVTIVSSDGKQLKKIQLFDSSNVLQRIKITDERYSASMYVGFGGNIYYYIAGEEYTEVFRIRRTWGEPDLYAMAINGYTDDSYGKYVEETLAKLSKAELRLLRNTVFALYGYTFKSEDLKNHFDKQVWYTDESKTASDMTLPLHRQKLLELVQAEEAKR